MDAQTKRDHANLLEHIAKKFADPECPCLATALKEVADDLRNAAEEPPPWKPKFTPSDMVQYKTDPTHTFKVDAVCENGVCQGRVRLTWNRSLVEWENCPHESELELAKPIPVPPPVLLGPEDRVCICGEEYLGTKTIARIYMHDCGSVGDGPTAQFAAGDWCNLATLTRVGPPAEITPGRAVHVLDKAGKFVREGLCIDVTRDSNGKICGYLIYALWDGYRESRWYSRCQLRLAACLEGA